MTLRWSRRRRRLRRREASMKTTDELVGLVMARAKDPLTRLGSGIEPGSQMRPPVSAKKVRAVEKQLSFSLGNLLARIYTEVGDGGFGPGYGLLPISRRKTDDTCLSENYCNLACAYKNVFEWPVGLLPICTWGCSIWTCVENPSADASVCTLHESGLYRLSANLHGWLEAWADGVALWDEMFQMETWPMQMNFGPKKGQVVDVPKISAVKGTPVVVFE